MSAAGVKRSGGVGRAPDPDDVLLAFQLTCGAGVGIAQRLRDHASVHDQGAAIGEDQRGKDVIDGLAALSCGEDIGLFRVVEMTGELDAVILGLAIGKPKDFVERDRGGGEIGVHLRNKGFFPLQALDLPDAQTHQHREHRQEPERWLEQGAEHGHRRYFSRPSPARCLYCSDEQRRFGQAQEHKRQDEDRGKPDHGMNPIWRLISDLDDQGATGDQETHDQNHEYGRAVAGVELRVFKTA